MKWEIEKVCLVESVTHSPCSMLYDVVGCNDWVNDKATNGLNRVSELSGEP